MRKIIIIIPILILLVVSCNKKKIVINNLNNNKIEIMGHAGIGYTSLYPINTQESILRCINEGADGSEIDIQLTSDNQLVAFHNSTLNDNTNFTGRIRDYSWTQLQEVRYTSTAQLNYKLMNLTEFFTALGGPDAYTFTLDIKLYPGEEDINDYLEDFTDAISDLYAQFQIDATVFVESQSQEFITLLQSKDAQIEMYIYPQTFEDGYDIALDLGLRGISINNDIITKEQVELAHSQGIFVTLWGVRIKSGNIEAVEKNPDMIQTDNVDHLVKYLVGT